MHTLKLSQREESSVLRYFPPLVFVDGLRRRDLRVALWEVTEAPRFGRARLLRTGPVQLPLPQIGSQVLITPPDRAGDVEFHCVTVSAVAEIGEQADGGVEVRHVLAETLGGRIATRRQLIGDATVEITGERVGFNTSDRTLASPGDFEIDGREAPVFSSAPDARRWRVGDALAYLLAAETPADVGVQDADELREIAGEIDLGELDITNLTTAEALVAVAERAALRLRAARTGVGLVFYRPGRQGRLRSVRLQPPGAKLLPSASNLWQARLELHRRPGRRGMVALGERKLCEATFELSPGWDPAKQTHRWRDFVRGASDDWPGVAEVYRKWVLNEHGRYSGQPWNLPVHDFSQTDAAFTMAAPRKFLPCLSTDAGGRSLGVVVEVRGGADEPWRRWTGPAWTCDDECAVLLGGDALPGDFFAAAADGEARVRVTATVRADAHLTAEVPGDANLPVETADLSDRAGWRGVTELSIFHGRDDLGKPDERDDSELLTELARRHAEAISSAVEARLTLPMPDESFHVGDRLEQIDGRSIPLASHNDSQACVRSVRHDAERLTTELILTG